MKLKPFYFAFGFLALASCLSKEEKMKKAEEEGNTLVAVKSKLIEGAGNALQTEGKAAAESATKGIGEVVKGVNSGFTESINSAKISAEGTFFDFFEECKGTKDFEKAEKKVTVYLISKKDFKGKLVLKAFDKDKKEIGRSGLEVDMKTDDAKYVDFVFDERMPLLQAETFSIK